jgi:hypothetical protein
MDFCRLLSYNFESQNNTDNTFPVADAAESIGSFLSSSLILACGDEVKVTTTTSGLTFQSQEKRDTILRIFFAVIALAILPLTIIGLICNAASSSYSSRNALYSKHTVKPVPTTSNTSTKKADTANSKADCANSNVQSTVSSTSAVAARVTATANSYNPPQSPAYASAAPARLAQPKEIEPMFTKLPEQEEWQSKVKECQYTDLYEHMGEFFKKLHTNMWELNRDQQEARNEKLAKEIAVFNENLFGMLKKSEASSKRDIDTPRDFLWNLQGYSAQPVPVSNGNADFQLKENTYYKLTSDDGYFLNQSHLKLKEMSDISTVDYATQQESSTAIKYSNGRLGIFFPKNVIGCSVSVNGKKLSCERGGGSQQSVYNFSEGDVVSMNGKYLFTVGAKGVLRLSGEKRMHKSSDFEGLADRTRFKSDAVENPENRFSKTVYVKPNQYTKWAVEVGIQKKLVPGFEYPEEFISRDDSLDVGREDKDGIIILADINNDPVFKKIVDYFKKEFELFSHSSKMLRLALFAEYVSSKKDHYDSMNQNYYLGEIINSGRWKRKNSPLLIKALADQLGLQCALISRGGVGYHESWNIFYEDGEFYVLIPSNLTMSKVDQFPGSEPEFQNNWTIFYGLKGIDWKELRKQITPAAVPPPIPVPAATAAASAAAAANSDDASAPDALSFWSASAVFGGSAGGTQPPAGDAPK